MFSTPSSPLYQAAKPFFEQNFPFGLTFDDVSLATNYSEVLPKETLLQTQLSETINLSVPIISSDMDTVTEAQMAIAMALNGGLGLIHYNFSPKQQIKEVARVKNHINGLIHDPITVSPDQYIGDVLTMVDAKSFSFRTFPVVDKEGLFLGLLLGRVVKNRYASKLVKEAMTPPNEVLTVREEAIAEDPIATADRIFNDNIGIHKLLVLNAKGQLRGLFTLSDIERIIEETRLRQHPARDSNFRLLCGAAVSVPRNRQGELDRQKFLHHVSALVQEGVDVIAVSTAHGHTAGVGQSVRLLRDAFPDLTLIAGNVTSPEGVAFLAENGANAIKVGQGPGSICTTRIVAGVGIPQLTALYTTSQEAAKHGVCLLADGGINKSGDIVKALTLADGVICGGLLAGCKEAPGRLVEINGKYYKEYRGMGSRSAMHEGSAARYGHSNLGHSSKLTAEGVEALKEESGSVDEVIRQLVGGIQAGMGYLGASTLAKLKQKARYIRVTQAGRREAMPHDIVEIKTKTNASL